MHVKIEVDPNVDENVPDEQLMHVEFVAAPTVDE